jgi:hypothetical protein
LIVIKYLFWRFSLFGEHLGSTENTTTEPTINAAAVPKTVRIKRDGAVNYLLQADFLLDLFFVPNDGGDMFL